LVTQVSITVLGETGQSIVPILVLEVSRADWRSRPDPQYWAKYFRSARTLLQPDPSQPAPASEPTVITPAPTPPPADPSQPPN
jgi:hypothetical protein